MDYNAGSSRSTYACAPLRGASRRPLQNKTLLVALAALAAGQQGSPSGVLKHLTDTLVGLGRALEVLVGRDLLTDLLTLSSC